jgi:uncharacterized protein YndB with AHSA1/START domain
MSDVPDRIEKQIVLAAPRNRVWKALADSQEFGQWFGIRLDGPFVAGRTIHARIVDPPGYEHVEATFVVDRVEPETLISFKWHPYGIDPKVDYSQEPMTTCAFTLADHEDGTLLRLVESGFSGVPIGRRALAFRMNDDGWQQQMDRIRKHVDG